ncbi:MAG: UDP-N-acetylmuramate dehydrogenase [Kiritimatiellales bacterium]|nr:UDP-N-acetylmuramate dehydrogenase [Kiritimatiellales bacterium]
MEVKAYEPLGPKTTMRIGGSAHYFADITTKDDLTEACAFAKEKNIPLVLLGAGANTVFADGVIEALVLRIKADKVSISPDKQTVTVESGKNLAMLINELGREGLDLSALTGIPGSVGGGIVGNAGQGPQGTWFDSFITEVTAFVDGNWKTFSNKECEFGYRDSIFKRLHTTDCKLITIWETALHIPQKDPSEIKSAIETLIKKRIETQPHIKTAGSCFKAVNNTPAWQLIDAAGLRGLKVGGVEISGKHANFLMNDGHGTFEDIQNLITQVQEKVPELKEVEMRLIGNDGIAL